MRRAEESGRETARRLRELTRQNKLLRQSEGLLRSLVENARDGINLLDLKTRRYVFMNPAQVALTGFTPEEINNISAEEAFERVHPDDREISVDQQERLFRGEAAAPTVEYRWKVKSGAYRWFSDSRSVLRDARGRAVAVVGVSRDITERKEAEEGRQRALAAGARGGAEGTLQDVTERARLEAEQTNAMEQWRLLFEEAADTMMLLRPQEGRPPIVVDINRQGLSFFGFGDKGEALGREVSFLEVEESVSRTAERLSEIMDKGEARFELVRDVPGRGFLTLEARVRTLRLGGALYFLATERDITDRKRAEAEIAKLLDQTREDARVKEHLVREVNHRVGNTLLSLLGIFIREKRLAPEEGRPWVSACVDRLSEHVRGLIAAHRVLSSKQWAPMSVTQLAEMVIGQVLASVVAAGAVTLEVSPAEARISPRQASSIALALNELATNTLKHAVPHRACTTIHVRVEEDGDFCTIEYRDDGPGYPPDVLRGGRPSLGLGLISEIFERPSGEGVSFRAEDGAVTRIRFRREDPTSV